MKTRDQQAMRKLVRELTTCEPDVQRAAARFLASLYYGRPGEILLEALDQIAKEAEALKGNQEAVGR